MAASIAANGGSDSAEYAKLAAAVESYDARVAGAPLDPRVVAGLAALAPAAAFGFVTNAPVVAGAWIASVRVPNEGWRASATGVAGTVLVPLVWSAEYAAAADWWGRRRARMFVAATAVGGIAAVALYDRWQHRRDTAPAADNEVAAVVASLTETRILLLHREVIADQRIRCIQNSAAAAARTPANRPSPVNSAVMSRWCES